MTKKKPIIAIDISSTGRGGGPYTSTMNIINSALKRDYEFRLIKYRTELGRFLSVKRIIDLKRQIEEIKPDIVHFTGLQLSGFHIIIACRLAGIKNTIVVVRGSSMEALSIGIFKKGIIFIFELLTIMFSTTFYGVSQYSSKFYFLKYFTKKSSGYIYNLPKNNLPKNNLFTPYCRKTFGFLENDIIVVSVARIVAEKGYHILADTIIKTNRFDNIKYLIVGNGEYLNEMQLLLQEQIKTGKVVFLGYRDDVDHILPLCDIFVLPTLHETLSNSILEASSHGLAIIASGVGGIPEIIKDGYNGILVKPSNSEELCDAIVKLALDEECRKRLSHNAKQVLDMKFSEEKILKQIGNLYDSLLFRG